MLRPYSILTFIVIHGELMLASKMLLTYDGLVDLRESATQFVEQLTCLCACPFLSCRRSLSIFTQSIKSKQTVSTDCGVLRQYVLRSVR